MASMVAAAVSVPSFCGLKAQTSLKMGVSKPVSAVVCRAAPGVRASMPVNWEKVGKVVVATAASVLLSTGSAFGDVVVKMGGDDGSLKFVPDTVSIAAGESVLFKNNKGFPHNVVFDDEAVPAGTKVEDLNHEDYLNSSSDSFSVTFSKPGTYKYYCEPHQGAGMEGTINVS